MLKVGSGSDTVRTGSACGNTLKVIHDAGKILYCTPIMFCSVLMNIMFDMHMHTE